MGEKSREFKIPLSRTGTVIATIEVDYGTRIEQIIIHPLPNFQSTDYVKLKIVCGLTIIYAGELISSGMIITPETPFYPKEEIIISLECLSLWDSLVGAGNTDQIDEDLTLCSITINTTDPNGTTPEMEDKEDFGEDFQSQWT